MNTMSDCPFCKILSTRERDIVAENEKWFSFSPIGPVNNGHILIVPKKHVDRIEQLNLTDWIHLRPMLRGLVTADYNIGINAGAVAGQTVFHLHIHLIPRKEGDVENVKGGIVGALGEKMESSQMQEYLESLNA